MALTVSEVLFHMCGYVSTSPLKAANSPVTAVTSPFAVLVMFSTDSGSGRVEAQGEHAKGTFGWDLGGMVLTSVQRIFGIWRKVAEM